MRGFPAPDEGAAAASIEDAEVAHAESVPAEVVEAAAGETPGMATALEEAGMLIEAPALDEATVHAEPQPAIPEAAIVVAQEMPAAAALASDVESLAPAAVPAIDTRPEPTTMEELLQQQEGDIRSFKHGDVVEGTVVRVDRDEILVDIGAKSEGVVSNRELFGRHAENQPQPAVGDLVLVYVLQPESNEGHAVLSLRRAGLERKWRSMQEQLEAGAIIEAPVIDHNKGGLIVDCGIRGFVPISQIVDFPRRPQNEQPRDAAQEIAEKLQPYIGRRLRLKILEVNRKANRLILSEKVALYEERREKRDELFSSLNVGQKVTGTVRSIAPFGVFIDLGGIDGLVHKSELSWNKVNNPEAGYRVGEQVEAEVIDINHERGRISLSIRRLQPDPWHSTVADFKVGDVIDGTVTKIVNFGSFVRVRDGLEGLIHISELSHQRVAHPSDVVHEGQTLKLKIISLDSERHRLGLSLKQAEEPPARPVTEPRPVTERRARPERGYDRSQAVQEPEGGIDNTLAAAFAQVREQVAAAEAATPSDEEVDAGERDEG
jgi:small subunit ribosomal protein S1